MLYGNKEKRKKRKAKAKQLGLPTRKKTTIKELDKLWADCVKAKAGYKSEISGRIGKQIGGSHVLNAHHIVGKPNHRLRYELSNGICLTKGEHKFGIHHEGRRSTYEGKIKSVRGENVYDQLNYFKAVKTKTDLGSVKLYLQGMLKIYKARTL